MNKPIIIALDWDGVIVDTLTLTCELLGKPTPLKDFVTYGTVYHMFGEEQFRRGIIMAHEATSQLQPIEGAIEGIKQLMTMPDVVCYILTANGLDSIPRIKRWLRLHDIDMPVMAAGIGGSKLKADFKYDVIVDDHPEAVGVLDSGGRLLIHFPAPYNNAPQSSTWANIPKIVSSYMDKENLHHGPN